MSDQSARGGHGRGGHRGGNGSTPPRAATPAYSTVSSTSYLYDSDKDDPLVTLPGQSQGRKGGTKAPSRKSSSSSLRSNVSSASGSQNPPSSTKSAPSKLRNEDKPGQQGGRNSAPPDAPSQPQPQWEPGQQLIVGPDVSKPIKAAQNKYASEQETLRNVAKAEAAKAAASTAGGKGQAKDNGKAPAKEEPAPSKDELAHIARMVEVYKTARSKAKITDEGIKKVEKQYLVMLRNRQAKKRWFAEERKNNRLSNITFSIPTTGEPKEITVQMWSSKKLDASPPQWPPGFEKPKDRRRAILNAVNPTAFVEKPLEPLDLMLITLTNLVAYDALPKEDQKIDKLLYTAVVNEFRNKFPTGGLVVHCKSSTYKEKNWDSSTSQFFRRYEMIAKELEAFRITYSAGLCDVKWLPEGLKGAMGAMRLLCAQLLDYTPFIDGAEPRLAFISKKSQFDAIWHGEEGELPLLFRNLICEIARYNFSAKKKDKTRIVAIVDSLDLIETNRAEFLELVAMFRNLCDELEWGDLGNYIAFEYILIHPNESTLDLEPHPLERHLYYKP